MRMLGPLAAVLALSAAAPALAQPTVSTVVVVGHWVRRGAPPRQLSLPVSYADLDLRLAGDQARLRHRIAFAARDICRQLGAKAPGPANLGRSCRDRAMRDALAQMKVAVMAANSQPPAYAVAVPAPPPGAVAVPVAPPQDNPYVAAPSPDDTDAGPR